VASLNIPIVVVAGAILVVALIKLSRAISRWRSRIREQNLLIEEQEKEIVELNELWNVNPSIIEWEKLLSRFLFFHP